MQVLTLTEQLGFCKEAELLIQKTDKKYDHSAYSAYWEKLYTDEAETGTELLRNALSPDEDGMKMLVCMLHCAVYTYGLYKKHDISDSVYFATMRFLSRFVNEYTQVHKRPAFLWGWWFYRQLSLKEFRLGELEYEMTFKDHIPVLSMHIPSRADISADSLHHSVAYARAFFTRYFPVFSHADIYCDSWMLSPVLGNLLPPSSRILAFQQCFDLVRWDRESKAAADWLFPRSDVPLQDLPEQTVLQKNAKAYMLNGGRIGWALGKMKPTLP